MKIGIDISQLAYQQIGVSNHLRQIVNHMVARDKENTYVLFYSSLRQPLDLPVANNKNVILKQFRFPPTFFDLLWNRLHIAPIEWFIGDVDVFFTSDWTEPPTLRAKKMTMVYDLIVYTYPEETHNRTDFSLKSLWISPNIVAAQKRKLAWVKKESKMVICNSESAKRDVKKFLGIEDQRLRVVYPGV